MLAESGVPNRVTSMKELPLMTKNLAGDIQMGCSVLLLPGEHLPPLHSCRAWYGALSISASSSHPGPAACRSFSHLSFLPIEYATVNGCAIFNFPNFGLCALDSVLYFAEVTKIIRAGHKMSVTFFALFPVGYPTLRLIPCVQLLAPSALASFLWVPFPLTYKQLRLPSP